MSRRNGEGKIGPLIIIGGAEDKEGESEILAEFVRLAGGDKARLVIMPVATDYPEEMGKKYTDVFGRLGSPKIEVIDVSNREMAFEDFRREALEKATGVFFTGGSQVRITSLMGGTPLDELLVRRQREEGLVIGGTSAGASIMADTMIVAGGADTGPRLGGLELGSGLGFLRDIIVDQHFAERGRVHRLLAAVAQNPRYLGLGIDEDTAVVVEDSIFRVLGAGSVTILDASDMRYNNFQTADDLEPLALEGVRLTVVPPGYRFNIRERRLIHEDPPKQRTK